MIRDSQPLDQRGLPTQDESFWASRALIPRAARANVEELAQVYDRLVDGRRAIRQRISDMYPKQNRVQEFMENLEAQIAAGETQRMAEAQARASMVDKRQESLDLLYSNNLRFVEQELKRLQEIGVLPLFEDTLEALIESGHKDAHLKIKTPNLLSEKPLPPSIQIIWDINLQEDRRWYYHTVEGRIMPQDGFVLVNEHGLHTRNMGKSGTDISLVSDLIQTGIQGSIGFFGGVDPRRWCSFDKYAPPLKFAPYIMIKSMSKYLEPHPKRHY